MNIMADTVLPSELTIQQIQQLRERLRANRQFSLGRLTMKELADLYAEKFGVPVCVIHDAIYGLLGER